MNCHHKFQRCIKVILGSVFLLGTVQASAFTECTVNLSSIYAGDNGYIWLTYDNGGSGYVLVNDLDLKNILALGTTALIAGKAVVVRYDANAVACNSSSRSDVAGIWLIK